MNEQDLIYFCKLFELGNYTQTAKYFEVTQPTISSAIKRLQKKYDDKLIIQKNRKSKLHLTSAGSLLYQKSKLLIKEISSMNYDVLHASDKRIRIAFSGQAGSIFIPEIIKLFKQENILHLLETKFERSADAFEDLSKGNIDVAIYSWMLKINDPNYYIRNLERTELVLITSPNHPTLKDKFIVSANELRHENFIARKPGYLTRECLEQEGKYGNFAPNIIYTSPNMKLLFDLVKENIGVALVMESGISVEDKMNLHIVKLKPAQKLWAYMQIAMRKSFIPNHYQKKGIELLRHFHEK